jgi:hypothetical protein
VPRIAGAANADRDRYRNGEPILDDHRHRIAGADHVRADQAVNVEHQAVAHDLRMMVELEEDRGGSLDPR